MVRFATVVRLALAGSRVDRLRVTLTAIGSMVATLTLLSAATVAAIGPGDGPYTSALLNESGLHVGVIIALIGLCVPVLVLLAQCSRIGAPARDRRLAALRLAGATPAEIGRITTVEAGGGSALGAVAGPGAYFALRAALATPVRVDPFGSGPATSSTAGVSGGSPATSVLRVPTDVLPPGWGLVVIVALVPALVAAGTLVALRRVVFTPFGVSRRVRARAPRALPLVLVAVGVGVFFLVAALARSSGGLPARLLTVLLVAGFVLAVGGLLAGQGALTQTLGRVVVGRASRPALLLAGRRMIAEPFGATRATAVLSVAVLVAAGARHLRNVTLAEQAAGDDAFYRGSYDLVDLVLVVVAVLAATGLLIAAAEGIVARRRTYAAVVASGTPRGVVARAILAELLLPLVPSLLLATTIGTVSAVGLFGRSVVVDDPATGRLEPATIGVAWTALGATLVLAVVIATVTTSASLLLLRRATDVAELRAAA